MAIFRAGLLGEIVGMSVDTLRTNKMRSALTVLGVVIGITSIVGMTSLLRGFEESVEALFKEMGPDTITIQKFGMVSMSSGRSFMEVIRRPNLTIADGRAIEREAPSVGIVDVWLGVTGMKRPRLPLISSQVAPMGWAIIHMATVAMEK